MSATDPSISNHPDELLEAYALDALEADEHQQVELHVEDCDRCIQLVAALYHTAGQLGFALEQEPPPPAVGMRIRQALSDGAPGSTGYLGVSAPAGNTPSQRGFTSPPWIMPLAAVLMLSLFSFSVFMNIQTSGRVEQMEHAEATTTAQLGQAMAETQQLQLENRTLGSRLAAQSQASSEGQGNPDDMMDAVREIRAASYLLAHPETLPLILEPPDGSGESEGVILVGHAGEKAMLMVFHMESAPSKLPYRVWLVRDGQRMPAGQVSVDSSGWGTMTIEPPESLFRFEWVNLTMVDDTSSNPPAERMVLRSKIDPSLQGR